MFEGNERARHERHGSDTGGTLRNGACLDLLEAFLFADVLTITLGFVAEGEEL